MATMVARGSSPLVVSGSRNKRKFRSETPPIDLSAFAPTGYEFFPEEKVGEMSDLGCCHPTTCDLCAAPREEEVEFGEFNDVDWGNLTETQLEEILLRNLDMIFKNAVKLITSYGYTEEVAMNAVLRSGICCGCKDTISNTVDNALAYLSSGKKVDTTLGENFMEELERLEKSVLIDMVNVLREMRPFFSAGDAMWCLLMCDMNVTHACALENDSANVMGNGGTSSDFVVPHLESTSNAKVSNSQAVPGFTALGPSKLNTMLPYSAGSPQLGVHAPAGIPALPSGKFCASSNDNGKILNFNPGKENPISSFKYVVESSCSVISQSCLMEEKGSGGRKSNVGITKRESMLRQKSVHFERSYRAFGSKAIPRGRRVGTLGSLALDKKCKSGSGTTCMAVKSASLKIKRLIQTEMPPASTITNHPISTGSPASSFSNPSQIANTDLSLSLASTSSNTISIKSNNNIGATPGNNHLSSQSDKLSGYWVAQNKKDQMLLNLAPRVQELQAQLQEWTEWAQQKVMQATCRLSKDKVELQTLRQEKDEVVRLKKEKQTLEENTRKKLSEMESALTKASGQIAKANSAARRLEIENAKLRQEMMRQEMEAAKLEVAVSSLEVSSRETMTTKKMQSWERQKAQFHEDLLFEKRKLVQLDQELKQALELRNQLQVKWKAEETSKDEALVQANLARKERRQIEVSGKATENAIRLKAETDVQKYKADIRRLEDQITKLRLKTDSSKLAALKWGGSDGSYATRISDARKESNAHFLAKIMDSLELGGEDVQRERECVMCLTEEMSVVFLPCAHQVVCTKCNGLHEKQGMKDCPSCRTPIQRRISVRSADS